MRRAAVVCDTPPVPAVSRSRARTVRFTLALAAALFLAGMLVYTTFSAASPERFPKQLAATWTAEQTYRVGGRVLDGSVTRRDGVLRFKLGHPGTGAGAPIAIEYRGTVPDPFREGRDVLIDVKRPAGAADDSPWIGQANSLITKCPSKFNGEEMNPQGGPVSEPAGT